MEAIIDRVENAVIVDIPYAKIDASCCDEFKEEMAALLAEPCTDIILDMHRVQFVDSAGIGAILSCVKQLETHGGVLKLCNVAKPVRALFELVQLHRLLDILETREDAIRAVQT